MLSSPSSDKNKFPILEVLKTFIEPDKHPKTKIKSILELASGSGVHVSFFAQHFPNVHFQPSEIEPKNMESIKAYIDNYELTSTVRDPIVIDLSCPEKCDVIKEIDMVYASNFTHISPVKCTYGAFDIASRMLKPESWFLIYGPFSIDGEISPESNLNFDKHLRNQNSEWGYRDTSQLKEIAENNGFSFDQRIAMPSNNWILAFRKIWVS